MSSTRKIGLGFGVLSAPLVEQLEKQDFKFKEQVIKDFQKEVDAINVLRFGSGLLTDSIVEKIIPKLYKKIVAHVVKENKLSVVKPSP